MNAGGALQEGICRALNGDAAVTRLLGGPNIFNEPPARTRFPYVTLAQTANRDWSSAGAEAREHILTLHIWSRGAQTLTQEIIGAVNAALAQAAISLPGRETVTLCHEFSEARRDPDGEIMHGIVRYRTVFLPR